MCCAKDWLQSPPPQRSSRKSKVRLHCLIIRRSGFEGMKTDDMELKNLKLYLENRSILEENEKLRQKAIQLRRENLALLSEFHNKFKSSSQLPTSISFT